MTLASVGLAVVRALHDCGVLSVFGALVTRAVGIVGSTRGWRKLLRSSLALAWATAPVWLVLQAVEMAGATTMLEAVAAAPVVLSSTGFGHALAVRLGLLGVAALPLWAESRAAILAAVLAAALACAAQIRMGHAAAPDGSWQVPAAAAHMLAAGAWIGGLPPLVYGLGDDPVRTARRFSILGLIAIVILAMAALAQAILLVGGLPGLLGSEYGHTVLIKTGLFLVLLGFAAFNRFRLSPALTGSQPARAIRGLRRSIYMEAAVGGIAVLAAAWLAGLPPGAHEQPIWPLPWQPSWDALDDPDVMGPLRTSGLLLFAALLAGVAALLSRRARILLGLAGVATGIVAACLGIPRMGAFAVPAYPSSFYESPTGFTKASVAQGEAVYRQDCAACHGPRGFGDGPRAAGLARRPAPLTGFHLLERSDGEMFWLVSKGVPSLGRDPAVMPGFDGMLSEADRWAVIDYVRTLAGAEPDDAPIESHHHH